ncbi:protein CcmA, bactofilin family [Sphingomonas guangdongensis]|uniref:Protein CcmA, bactofilin family n=1 Tax=Sphingomonas guangdongensis TaxID=1141890 RepID=A0A285R2C7_9SPHN|nr:polymer-forming cytoskeletal protein [Sphingomonas guangdongensis]SOB86517.1 protein CcmA, bactofilin family [Sphingomonas guangdongensis]
MADRAADAAASEGIATISAGVVVTGEVTSAVDLQIDGQVTGDVHCDTLYLGESGVVKGNIRAERIRVSGTVDGNITAGDLAVEAAGRVRGDIGYVRLKVTAGAVVEGTLKHRGSDAGSAVTETAPLKLVEKPEAAPQPRRVFVD